MSIPLQFCLFNATGVKSSKMLICNYREARGRIPKLPRNRDPGPWA